MDILLEIPSKCACDEFEECKVNELAQFKNPYCYRRGLIVTMPKVWARSWLWALARFYLLAMCLLGSPLPSAAREETYSDHHPLAA